VLVNDVVKDIPFGVTSANRSWVLAHKDAARNFQDAYIEAVEWFYDPSHATRRLACDHAAQRQHEGGRHRQDLRLLPTTRLLQSVQRGCRASTSRTSWMFWVGFGDLEKRFEVERLIVPEVTRIVD